MDARGLVAVYNVLKYIGKFKYFQDVILEAEMNEMLWNNGMFGIKDEKTRSDFNALLKIYKTINNGTDETTKFRR